MSSLRLPKRWLAAGALVLGVALPTGALPAQPPLPPVPPVAGFEPPTAPATPAAAPQPAAPSSGFGRLRSLWTGRSNNTNASPYGATPNASSNNPYGATPSASPLPIGNPSEPPIAEQIALPMEQPTVPAYPVAPGMPPVAQPIPNGNVPVPAPVPAPVPVPAPAPAPGLGTVPPLAAAPAPAVVSQPIPGACGCGQNRAPQAAQYGVAQPEPQPRRGFFSRLFGR